MLYYFYSCISPNVPICGESVPDEWYEYESPVPEEPVINQILRSIRQISVQAWLIGSLSAGIKFVTENYSL